MNWYKKAQYLEELEAAIPSTTLSGIYYHGSLADPNNIFTELEEGYSDWGAIWVTDEESMAEGFAKTWHEPEENEIPIVFQVQVNLNKVAEISDQNYEWEEFKDIYAIDDPREAIPHLRQMGYDGWITTGSMGPRAYTDIAIFGGNIQLTHVKVLKNDPEDEWSEWSDWEEV